MRYTEKDFSSALMKKINHLEEEMQKYGEELLNQYKPLFKEKGMELFIGITKEGEEGYRFVPGCRVSLDISLNDEYGGVMELNTIPIWECDYTFCGIPIAKWVVGCHVTGEFTFETLEELKAEAAECMIEMKQYLKNK